MADERPLDEAALARLKEELAAGKRPSLVLLSGGAGLPAGSRGQLLRIDDPPTDDEFLHLKVGNDELPFAPTEVGLPGRRGRSSPSGRGRQASSSPPPTLPEVEPPAPEPILEPVRPDRRTRAERVVEPPPAPAGPAVADVDEASAPRRPRRPARSAATSPRLTLTLRFADFAWTIEAQVGGRREKASPVSLAAIRALADQLEESPLRRQLLGTVEACRAEAEKRAAALREELARLETQLAAFDE